MHLSFPTTFGHCNSFKKLYIHHSLCPQSAFLYSLTLTKTDKGQKLLCLRIRNNTKTLTLVPTLVIQPPRELHFMFAVQRSPSAVPKNLLYKAFISLHRSHQITYFHLHLVFLLSFNELHFDYRIVFCSSDQMTFSFSVFGSIVKIYTLTFVKISFESTNKFTYSTIQNFGHTFLFNGFHIYIVKNYE